MSEFLNKDVPAGWQVFDDGQALAQYAVELIIEQAAQAIAQRGAFHLVSAGGTTPNQCYALLAQRKDQDWSKWFVYMGDERVLPADDAQRNAVALKQAWLSKVTIPAQNCFLMPTELGLEAACQAYKSVMARVTKFDCVMLGMGEDGHTASLFPGHEHPDATEAVVMIIDSPKPPPERISLSYQALSNTRVMLKLVTGAAKKPAVDAWLGGEALPISQVQGEATFTLLDRSAWLGGG